MDNKTMENAKEQIQKEIEILETALLFRTRHELKIHINEQKKLANKFFGCDYEISEIVTHSNSDFNYQKHPRNRGYDGFNSYKKPYNANNFPLNHTQTSVNTSETAHHNAIDDVYGVAETGIFHTYETFASAENPFAYLATIKVGDKVRYFDKNESRIKTGLIVNIVDKKQVGNGYTQYAFFLRNSVCITYKDFR